MHLADWFATFAFLAGASTDDPKAASSGLPLPDSVNAWAHITSDPTATRPLRPLMQLSSNTIINCTDGHKLIVSLCERNNKTQGLLRCDVTGMNMWSPSVYPNASQPDGGGADALDAANCTSGCLWNVLDDPEERRELSASAASTKAELMDALVAAQVDVIKTPTIPDDPACCAAAARRGSGFLGPWLE